MPAVDLRERDYREDAEDQHLGAQQNLLDSCRELDTAIADPGHHSDPDDRSATRQGRNPCPSLGEPDGLLGSDTTVVDKHWAPALGFRILDGLLDVHGSHALGSGLFSQFRKLLITGEAECVRLR